MHLFECRVYYEDTDCGGVVYHSNYLKFAERARTEMIRSYNIHQSELAKIDKISIVVHSINTKFLQPAKLDDLLVIKTEIIETLRSSIKLLQKIYIKENLCTELVVNIAFVKLDGEKFKPVRIPENIAKLLIKCP